MSGGRRLPRDWIEIEREVAAALREEIVGERADLKLGVGVSGGADSVFLLHLLAGLAERKAASDLQLDLVVLHVHHGVRGADADADESFVERLAMECGARFEERNIDPPNGAPSEEWLREERFAAFEEMLAESQTRRLCLAHHRDDQAETILHRLLRGSGPEGLAGMRRATDWRGVRILRPLLGVPRDLIRRCLDEAGFEWREDASNADAAYTRNRLRGETIPALEAAYHPGLPARLAALADQLADDRAYWEETVASWLAEETDFPRAIGRERLRSASAALRRRILQAWLSAVAPPEKQVERIHVEAADRFVMHATREKELMTVAGLRLARQGGSFFLK